MCEYKIDLQSRVSVFYKQGRDFVLFNQNFPRKLVIKKMFYIILIIKTILNYFLYVKIIIWNKCVVHLNLFVLMVNGCRVHHIVFH